MPKGKRKAGGIGEVAAQFNQIETLQAQVETHLGAIRDLYSRIAQAAAGIALSPGRAPKTFAVDAVPSVKTGGRRRRGKRGALKEALRKVLAGGRVLGPAAIVDALQKSGFTTASKPNVFYNTVYQGLRKSKEIEKTKEGGFRLKGGK